MRGTTGRIVGLALLAPALSGCMAAGEARYVYQDGSFGVVAIPRNAPGGWHDYRQQADKLMAAHFPDGYEIVRAEEVVEGTRTLTTGGTGAVEVAPDLAPLPVKVGKLGRSVTRNQSDQLKIKECRIIYRRADRDSPEPGAAPYADEPALSPALYLDPNEVERRNPGGALKGPAPAPAPKSAEAAKPAPA